MSDLFVDSCVAAKWVLPEDDNSLAQQIARDVAIQGGRLVLVDLAITEVANAIWKLAHRGKIQPPEAFALLGDFQQIIVETVPADLLLPRAFELALKYDITVYDALFVAGVEASGFPGVTSDEPLVNKAGIDYPQIKVLRNW